MAKNDLIVKEDENTNTTIYRGDIYYADLGEDAGNNQSWICPVVIVSNDVSNRFRQRVIVVPITDILDEMALPSRINIRTKDSKLKKDSVIVCEEIRVIDAVRLKERVSTLSDDLVYKINMALSVALSLDLIVFPR